MCADSRAPCEDHPDPSTQAPRRSLARRPEKLILRLAMFQKCKFSRINHNESIFVLPQRQGEVFHSGKGLELHQNFLVIYQKSILASPRNMNRRFVEDLNFVWMYILILIHIIIMFFLTSMSDTMSQSTQSGGWELVQCVPPNFMSANFWVSIFIWDLTFNLLPPTLRITGPPMNLFATMRNRDGGWIVPSREGERSSQ